MMRATDRKIVTLEQLREIREQLRAEGRIVVQCHGCFDIVHPGHIRYLQFAREQGDCLIVTVSGDQFVGKGPDRPYIEERLRAENLAALELVDWVCVDHNSWAGPVLEVLRPDIYVKGKEYESSADTRFAREKELVESFGGAVIYSSGEVVYSSTFILGHLRDRLPAGHDQIEAFCRRHQVSAQRLEDLVRSFVGQRVLVLGDAIVDRYVHCDVASVAAESPVLNAVELRSDTFIGAAGLVAKQCVALGARATFLTALSSAAETGELVGGLERAGVEVEAVIEQSRAVYMKTRYLADGIKVFKVNQGRYAPLSSVSSKELQRRLAALVQDHDAVIVLDFGYGLFSNDLIEAISSLPRQGKAFYLDVSHGGTSSLLRFRNPAAVTPTESELRQAMADHQSGLSNLAMRFFERTQAGLLTITMGKRGAVSFYPAASEGARLESDYLPSFSNHPVDTVGAGDVFLATSVLAGLAGGTSPEALFLGMAAAGLHVERLGNEAVQLRELSSGLRQRWSLG
jgi:rfaE bifunctional protein kinase chain/domain/rfaE bifunctional protein nucleotidyltransferase chain/domain